MSIEIPEGLVVFLGLLGLAMYAIYKYYAGNP